MNPSNASHSPGSGSVNISIGGNLNGEQIAMGHTIKQTQITNPKAEVVSDTEWLQLRQELDTLKAILRAYAPTEKQGEAIAQVDALEQAITAGKPDLTRMQHIKHWFAKYLPTFTGAVTSVIVHPIVGKIVEASGQVLADKLTERFQD
ncbi:hypothetical protein [Vacuolonema iberomarrocanum]|uniref:hypothetical protein n=1 Tax=Vacuolonema iberomarrocanum TaxID=3454632 RepID=UPI0019F44673|nr:hypothetical protein [filamentous cyanobacterium LEGE 07170]